MSDSSNFIGDFSKFHLDPGDPPPNVLSSASYQQSMVDSSVLAGLKQLNPSVSSSSSIISSFSPSLISQAMGPISISGESTGLSSSSSLAVSGCNLVNISSNSPDNLNLNSQILGMKPAIVKSVDPVLGRTVFVVNKRNVASSDVNKGNSGSVDAEMCSGMQCNDETMKMEGVGLSIDAAGKSSLPEFVDNEEIECAMKAFATRSCTDPDFIAHAKAFISVHCLCPEFEQKYGPLIRSMGSKGNAFKRKSVLENNSVKEAGKKGRDTENMDVETECKFGVTSTGYEEIKLLQDKVVKEGVNVAEMKLVREAAQQGKQFIEKQHSLPMLWPIFNMGKGNVKNKVSPSLVVDKMIKKGCSSIKQINLEIAKEKHLFRAEVDRNLAVKGKNMEKKQVNVFAVPVPEKIKFNVGKKEDSYVGALKGRPKTTLTDPIEFCPPVTLENGEKVAVIQSEFLDKAEAVYKTMLYGYFVGSDVNLQFVRFNLYKMWRKFGIIDISTNGNGVYYFKFRNEEGMKAVIEAGPWVVNNIPLCLKKWEMGMNVVREEPECIPLWITLKNLPLELWNTKCICQIVSCIGKPLAFDYITTERCAKKNGIAGFARILVEVSAKSVLPEYVKTIYPVHGELMGGSLDIIVEYQKKVVSCTHCGVFGHSFANCKKRPLTDEERVVKEQDKANSNSLEDNGDKGKGVINEDGFVLVDNRKKSGRQQGSWDNGMQQNRVFGQRVTQQGNMGKNGRFNGQQWRRVGNNNRNKPITSQTTISLEDLKQHSKDGNGDASTSKGNSKGGLNSSVSGMRKSQGSIRDNAMGRQKNEKGDIDGQQVEVMNRFEALSSDLDTDIISDQKRSENAVLKKGVEKEDLSPKQNKPSIPGRTILTRQAAAAEKLKAEKVGNHSNIIDASKNSKPVFSNEKLAHGLSEAEIYNVAKILNKNNPKLLKEQEVEIIKMVMNEKLPTKDLYMAWTKFQRVFYFQMCDTTNFHKGINTLVEIREAVESENDVESDEDQAAQDMKVDKRIEEDTRMQGTQEWESNVQGYAMYSVMSKLKALKKPLRQLGKLYGNLHDRVVLLSSELAKIQSEVERDPLNSELRDEEIAYLKAYKLAVEDEESMLKQQAKVDWLAGGDQNSSYFHKVVKGRQIKSRIWAVQDMNGNIYEGVEVGNVFVKHFQDFMGKEVNVNDVRDPASFGLNEWSKIMVDSEMYFDIGMVKFLTKKEAHDQILLNDKRKLLTFQSQSAGICKVKCGWHSLNLISNYQSMQEYRQLLEEEIMPGLVDDITMEKAWLLTAQSQNGIAYKDIHGRLLVYWNSGNQNREIYRIDRHEVRVGKADWCFPSCFLIWFRHGIFALKDTPSVEVKVEIFMRIRSWKWYCYIEELRDKSWMNFIVENEGLKLLKKKDADYQRKIINLMMDWCMEEQELTLKSQWPAMKKMGSEFYSSDIEGLGWYYFLHGVCNVIWANDGGRLGFGTDMGCLYGLDERIGAIGEWTCSCMGQICLVDWRLDVYVMEAYFGIVGFGWCLGWEFNGLVYDFVEETVLYHDLEDLGGCWMMIGAILVKAYEDLKGLLVILESRSNNMLQQRLREDGCILDVWAEKIGMVMGAASSMALCPREFLIQNVKNACCWLKTKLLEKLLMS
ncbi:hypothetical protein QVD17_11184 [Tagetes erecta]|uniref:DUF4283 domain-containing protein n=1 Tax=Tagetes erecta TaxID=13708 RepID=A0AAD8L2J2_TARER|nr:hypothetical protein QVD17_11184 [Tagetes erecta]